MTTTRTPPLNFSYDTDRDVLTVEGVAYSGDLFRAWAAHGLVVNTPFVITQRRDDGAVLIERMTTEPPVVVLTNPSAVC